MALAWSALSVAKACFDESFVTDADERLTKIVNGTEELWKKHQGCLRPILLEMVYNIERHVKKYGPIKQETMLRMLFMCVVFTDGKLDFTIKTHVKKLKDNREYIKKMQSWAEMQKVADGFIELVIEHDDTYGEDKRAWTSRPLQQHVRSETYAGRVSIES